MPFAERAVHDDSVSDSAFEPFTLTPAERDRLRRVDEEFVGRLRTTFVSPVTIFTRASFAASRIDSIIFQVFQREPSSRMNPALRHSGRAPIIAVVYGSADCDSADVAA
jgi:hypothetical protein